MIDNFWDKISLSFAVIFDRFVSFFDIFFDKKKTYKQFCIYSYSNAYNPLDVRKSYICQINV